jgi:hypothetical protein
MGAKTIQKKKKKKRYVCQTSSGGGGFFFVGLAYQGKDIVFRFIIEYSSLRYVGPLVIGLFLHEDF